MHTSLALKEEYGRIVIEHVDAFELRGCGFDDGNHVTLF
jgi:hypothetical protein